MKISPLAQSSGGSPGQSLTGSSNTAASPDKIAAAKAIIKGETPLRVNKADNYVDPQVAKAEASIRKIKLKSNYSPDRYDHVLQEQSATQEQPVSATSDPSEQTTVTTEETKPLSPQFAALAKQRRSLQVKERELADREKVLESKLANDGSSDVVARLKSEPMRVLQEQGILNDAFYNSLTEHILSNQSGANIDVDALKNQIREEFKKEFSTELSARDTQAEEAALNEMMREATTLAKDGETYELVRESKSLPKVRELIRRTYKNTGEVLDVTEALDLVEKDLLDQNLKIANLSKIKNQIAAPAQSTQQQQTQTRTIRTLTNRDTASVPLSAKERAIQAFYGLKK